MARDDISSYLPLTETTYYILLALTEPLHGYAVMRKIQGISEGTVNVGAGTLYNAVSKLQQEGLVVKVPEEDRRRFYHLTAKVMLGLESQIERELVSGTEPNGPVANWPFGALCCSGL